RPRVPELARADDVRRRDVPGDEGARIPGAVRELIESPAPVKVHEYQAKSLLSRYGVAVPRGEVADTADKARDIARKLGGAVVVQAQIHAGGRGKGVRIRVARDPDEAFDHSRPNPGMPARTPQH